MNLKICRKYQIFKGIMVGSIVIAILTGIASARADVLYLPETLADLPPGTQMDHLIGVKGVRVAWMNLPALLRDFPFLGGQSPHQIEEWLLANCARIAMDQTQLTEVRNSEIPLEFRNDPDRTLGYRQPGWGRAASIPVRQLDGIHPGGLIDVKGIGLFDPFVQFDRFGKKSPRSIDQQKLAYKSALEKGSQDEGAKAKLDAVRLSNHSDGLASFVEAIAEITRGGALQRSFDEYNAKQGTRFETVENYAILVLPFDILKDIGSDGSPKRDRAALILRQPHYGRTNSRSGVQTAPDTIYIDIHGGKQTDRFGHSSVDMGGVHITSGKYLMRFLSPEQIEYLPTLFVDKPTYQENKAIFDPLKSSAWRYAGDTAAAYLSGDTNAVSNHYLEMVGPPPPEPLQPPLTRIRSRLRGLDAVLTYIHIWGIRSSFLKEVQDFETLRDTGDIPIGSDGLAQFSHLNDLMKIILFDPTLPIAKVVDYAHFLVSLQPNVATLLTRSINWTIRSEMQALIKPDPRVVLADELKKYIPRFDSRAKIDFRYPYGMPEDSYFVTHLKDESLYRILTQDRELLKLLTSLLPQSVYQHILQDSRPSREFIERLMSEILKLKTLTPTHSAFLREVVKYPDFPLSEMTSVVNPPGLE